MTRARRWGGVGAALLGASGCTISPGDSTQPDTVEQVAQPITAWTAATTTIGVIQNLYSGINWFNCQFAQTCPESEAHREATRIISQIESTITVYDTDAKISDVNVLLDRAALDYAHPDLVTQSEEQDLVNSARDVFIHFRDRLNNTDGTNEAQVNAAYALAPFFNVLAALVDNIGQIALSNGRVPMDWGWMLLPVGTLATKVRDPASMTVSTGVHAFPGLHAAPAFTVLPEGVQRLAATR